MTIRSIRGRVGGVVRHPSHLRAAVRRRLFSWRLGRVPLKRCDGLVDLGTDYGGWVVPADLIRDDWTCYCVGAGSDVSFEVELLKRGPRVRSFDPFDVFRRFAERETAGAGDRFSFGVCAIAEEDGPVTMYGRQDEEAGSVSGVNLYEVDTAFEKPGRSLPSLMSEYGDRSIELLKLDVEGMEYGLLESLDPHDLGVEVLCVEFHPVPGDAVREALGRMARLRASGYAPVSRHGTEFTFVAEDLLAKA